MARWEVTKQPSSKATPNLQGPARDKSKPQALDRRNPNLDVGEQGIEPQESECKSEV